jgi:fused signal recognition particle receptor
MNSPIVYVLIAAVVIAVVAYLVTRKKPELPAAPEERKLPEKRPAVKKPTTERPKAKSEPAPAPEEPEGTPAEAHEKATAEPAPERRLGAEIKERVALEPSADVASMRQGLARSRESGGFFGRLRALFSGKKEIAAEVAESIEEVLLASDVGVKTTEAMLRRVRDELAGGDLVDSAKVWQTLREEAVRILSVDGKAGPLKLRVKPTVVLMVGVNGAGKTTTIGKLATRLKAAGNECVLAAGDTFRAAAVQQLVVWGQRVGCEVVRGKDGADPGSVIFDAIKKAEELGADIVLADTAGRLHTKQNLMSEMKKIAKTAAKAMDGAPHETLLVIDATNGQNALAQAKEFQEALDLSGIVLTKLDGTAKGGMVLGICETLGLPVRFVGLGERPNDLHDFVPAEFVEALLGKESEENAAE